MFFPGIYIKMRDQGGVQIKMIMIMFCLFTSYMIPLPNSPTRDSEQG